MSLCFLTSPVLNKELQTVAEQFKHCAGQRLVSGEGRRCWHSGCGSCVPAAQSLMKGNAAAALHPVPLSLHHQTRCAPGPRAPCTVLVTRAALRPPRGAQRGDGRVGNTNRTLPCLSQAQTGVISPSEVTCQAQRSMGAQRQLGIGMRESGGGKSCPGPS